MTVRSATLTSIARLQMVPSQSPPATKRKASSNDPNSHLPSKKPKKEKKSNASTKRKHHGEKTRSGLLIVPAPEFRVSSSHPITTTSTTVEPTRTITSQPQPSSSSSYVHLEVDPSGSTLKKGRTQFQLPPPSRPRPALYSMSQGGLPPPVEDSDVEKDVQAMEDETVQLRRSSRGPPSSNPNSSNGAIPFPPRIESSPNKKKKPMITDMSLPITTTESPQIERNKLLRGGAMAVIGNGRSRPLERNGVPGPNHRRKSSLSRGKRTSTSFATSGIITQPHNSVSDSSFYKHIDSDLPNVERIRQLLIWCSLRAAGISSGSGPSTPKQFIHSALPSEHPPLPPLSEKAAQVLRSTQEDIVRMLAEKRIDLSLHDPQSESSSSGTQLKENAQNIQNRLWEVTYSNQIKHLQEEEEAWKKVSYMYDTYAKKLRASAEKRKSQSNHESLTPSAKSRGKRRDSGDHEIWIPGENELAAEFSRGLALAKSTLGSTPLVDMRIAPSVPRPHSKSGLTGAELEAEVDHRLLDVEFKLDLLYTRVDAARRMTNFVETYLTRRFDAVWAQLAARRNISTASVDTNTDSAPKVLATSLQSELRGKMQSRGDEALSILRAMAKVDEERPPEKMGDAARRAAREVQRVQESGLGVLGERRLTGLPVPSTPRKVPGTPKRGGTPGKDKDWEQKLASK